MPTPCEDPFCPLGNACPGSPGHEAARLRDRVWRDPWMPRDYVVRDTVRRVVFMYRSGKDDRIPEEGGVFW